MIGPRRILLTGGSGQIGKALQALPWPDDVSLETPARHSLDLGEPNSCRRAISDAGYAAVVNTAAFTAVDQAETNVSEAFQTNAAAVATLAEACRNSGTPLVHVSTDYVFSGQSTVPWTEVDPTVPLGVYGASKLAGELAVTSTGGRALILRTAWVVSPWRHNFVKTMLRLARDRDSIGVVSDQVGSPTSAKDIARAIQTIALRMVQDSAAPTGIYHYVNSGRASWADLAEHVFTVSRELGGSSAAVKRISTADYPTPVRRPGFSVLSTDKIERDFGIRPDDWRDSVKDVVQSIILAEGI